MVYTRLIGESRIIVSTVVKTMSYSASCMQEMSSLSEPPYSKQRQCGVCEHPQHLTTQSTYEMLAWQATAASGKRCLTIRLLTSVSHVALSVLLGHSMRVPPRGRAAPSDVEASLVLSRGLLATSARAVIVFPCQKHGSAVSLCHSAVLQ